MSLSAPKDLATWRNAALGSLSFAGLVLLTDGQSLIATADPAWLYFSPYIPGWTALGPFLASLLLLAATCLTIWAIWPIRFEDEARAALLYILCILSALLTQGFFHPKYIFWVWFRVVAVLAVIVIYLVRRRWLAPLWSDILVVTVWVLAANIAFTGKRLFDLSQVKQSTLSTTQAPNRGSLPRGSGRTVIVIFDEFDYRLAFESRPPGFSLPQLDRLRRESLFLTNARPAGVETMGAISSYITGKPFREVRPDGPGRLILFPSPTGEPRALQPRQSLFGRLNDMGARVALIGFYHDYCRLFEGLSIDCQRYAAPDASAAILSQSVHGFRGFATGFVTQLLLHPAWTLGLPYSVGAFLTRPAATTHLEVVTEIQAEDLSQAMSKALRAAADPAYDFVYVHIPIPHPPGLSSRLNSWIGQPLTGVAYFDNILVADGFTAALRQHLTEAGLWDQTNLILTSDHPLRRSTWERRPRWTGGTHLLGPSDRGRIPFAFKPAGGGPGVEIAAPIPMLCLHDFLLALASGHIAGMHQAKDWMTASSAKYPLQWPVRTISGLSLD